MANKLRLAVIGTGGIARGAHLPVWTKMSNVEIVAVCDIVPGRAAAVARDLGIEKAYEDYHDVLQLQDVDAVDICTPNYMHSVIAVDALRAGKQVLCEKPDAVSPAEAAKMMQAARETGNLMMTIRNNRFEPHATFLKKYIEDGHMGDIYAARCGWIRRRGIPGKGGWFTTKEQSGGGPLIDLGVHFIDVSLWLMGNPKPVGVSASSFCKFANTEAASDSVHSQFGEAKSEGTFDVEDLVMGFIRLDNGACLQIEFSWASNIEKEDNFFEFRGTKAGASFHGMDNKLKIFGEVNGRVVDIVPQLSGHGGHANQIRHFADCVVNGAKPIVTPEQGLEMITLLDAIYRSAHSGLEVRL